MTFAACDVQARSDMPRCDSSRPDFSMSPYCLPNDYNKDIVPPTNGMPLHINVDIWVFEVEHFQWQLCLPR